MFPLSKKTRLHPSVEQFKQFVNKHPLLIKEVREEGKTWQDFYEEWTILGESDQVWERYKKNNSDEEEVEQTLEPEEETEKQTAQLGDLLSLLKSINLNDIQGHVEKLSGFMTTVQGLLQSFQSNSNNGQQGSQGQQGLGQQQSQGQQVPQNQQSRQQPFNWRQF